MTPDEQKAHCAPLQASLALATRQVVASSQRTVDVVEATGAVDAETVRKMKATVTALACDVMLLPVVPLRDRLAAYSRRAAGETMARTAATPSPAEARGP